MSSSGRFQSHLFNFVSRQAQKIADQTKKAARHLKVATIWGTQILLYPVYVLFQSTRLIGQKLRQTVQRSVLRLRLSKVIPQLSNSSPSAPLTVDTPIQRVLTAIQDSWLLAGANSANLAELESDDSIAQSVAGSVVTIQGIASLLPTGKLVLVTIDNQVMDVLTIEQQTHLKQRIIWEMANYWRYWRRHYIAQAHPTLLQPPEDRATLLPPVRVFRQLMAWVQSGPIAIAANLFQESTLVVEPAPLDWFSSDLTLSEFNPSGLITGIPTVADLAKLIQQLPSLGEMESLVWAAIRYFFGERPKKQLDTGLDDQTTSIASANNSWLTSEEVFGSGTLGAANPRSYLKGKSAAVQIEKTFTPLAHLPAQKDSKTLALPPQRTVTIGQSLQNWVKRSLPQPISRARSRSTLVHQKPSHRNLTRSTPQTLTPSRDQVQAAISTDRDSIPTLQKSPRSTRPDYIDTQATPIGYVKSPLTKFLEWLDSGVVWLEKQLAAFWNLLTRRS
ncbi:hypothetical protein C7B65_14645 [Phormidesmis priestleyi ULC007]|uniref:Uncharacterized protein n=1 Tax=Phormidesmis priestleyi ULC007 TaxID=1920490 RepID=A0A2T1DDJ2_9CYAN|nr:hypothetical protein [Phormidesmis priestleyi]PSB18536.1 hypothetical protein C7B65_14645 [Phormidesmis priestleyi ULC007]PZO49815.1 MAG: hypothetical protein DCF14_13435 [Phormidesmis priestleyi]